MQFNRWAAWLSLALLLFVGGLACETTDRVLSVAQANTATPTRTPTRRPTFTVVPTSTNTPIPPTNTPLPTATRTATRRPPTATPKPPTPRPQATTPPQPTTPRYQYSAAGSGCEHSGSSWIKGSVYADKNDPNSGMPGVKVVFGGSAGDAYAKPELTGGDGVFAFTLTADTDHRAAPGTYYVWIVDESGNRISEMAGPIRIEGGSSDSSCWAGSAFFTKNF